MLGFEYELNNRVVLPLLFIAILFPFKLISQFSFSESSKGQNNLNSALDSLQQKDKVFNKLMTAESYISAAKAYQLQNRVDDAIHAGLIAFNLLSTSSHYSTLSEVALLLSEMYKSQNDFKNSLYYFEWYHKSESIILKDRAKETGAESDGELINDTDGLDIESLNLSNKKRDQLIYILAFISMILAAFLYAGYRLYKTNSQATLELTQKNAALFEAEKTLEIKNQELEKYIESNIQLEQFAHVASHDLKTPLRTISSFAGLLKKNFHFNENEKAKGYLNFVENATKQMSILINDLLSYTQINSQKLNISQVYPSEIFVSLRETLAEDIKSRKARIVINSLPVIIYADKTKFKRICQNLITNGIKFVKPGVYPVVHIHGQELEDAYMYTISDNGIGISKEFQKEIFNPYKQLNTKSEYEGSGLGLSITKKLVEQHNGSLTVHSELNQGSTFTFTIPKRIVER